MSIDYIQDLMNSAYERWQQNSQWSQQDFWDHLDADERFAVFFGNFNYQVQNGGLMQWADNGYMTDETVGYITRACDRADTELSRKVAQIVRDFARLLEDYGWAIYDKQRGFTDDGGRADVRVLRHQRRVDGGASAALARQELRKHLRRTRTLA